MSGVLVKRWPFTEAEVREQAYRHALKYAGYLPRSIDVAVEKNREFIKTGKSK